MREYVKLSKDKKLYSKPKKLDSWYYEGEWMKYGLRKSDSRIFAHYSIGVGHDAKKVQ